MSPALLDTGVQSQAVGGEASEGQVSTNLSFSEFVCDDRVRMNPPNDANPNFQFSASSTAKPAADRGGIGAIQGLSRPRIAKTRKPRAMGSTERKSDPSFNPFRGVPSGSSVAGVDVIGSGLDVNRGGDIESSILDEIRKMRLADEKVSKGGNGGLDLLDEMKKLDIEDSVRQDASVSFKGKSFTLSGDCKSNVVHEGVGDGLSGDLKVLPNELMKKLNVKDCSVPDYNGPAFGVQGNQGFEFGNRKMQSDSAASSMVDTIANKMGNLCVNTVSGYTDESKTNVRNEKVAFGSSNMRSEVNDTGGEPHSMILDDLGKLKLGDGMKKSDDGTRREHQFLFTSKQDSSEAPSPKGNLFTIFHQNPEFGARREPAKAVSKKTRVKSKESTISQPWAGNNVSPKGNSFQYKSESPDSYSPMDISPYQENVPDNRYARGTSLTSEESTRPDDNLTSNASHDTQPDCVDMVDDDLISATEHLGISDDNCMNDGERAASQESTSAAETESFKSANELIENCGQNEEVSSQVNEQARSGDNKTQFFSASSSESKGGFPFTFSASTSTKGQAVPVTRNQKKKNRARVGQDPYNALKSTLLSDSSSTSRFSSMSRSSSPLSNRGQQNEDISPGHGREEPNQEKEKVQPAKQETPSSSAADSAAKEACEKWRIRGNQAYSSGDLGKAEDCYTQGLNCISKTKASRDGLRALMLCYSNRAAIRMSLGRYRDALADCKSAGEIDPNFFRVQVRKANCYLALGEVAETTVFLMKLLQSGTEACADRKLIVEASESIQKAQKVSQCIDHSAELLRHRTVDKAKQSLQVIDEALAICPYSEKLLQMKADAFFMMRMYKDVIELCEQTLQSAEKNFPLLDADNQSSSLEPSEVLKKYSFRIWRYSFVFNSYFYLGRVEDGLDFLEKQADLRPVTDRCGTQVVESFIPLIIPARELVKHKSAGNAAFKAGKNTEAVEHYSAALACNTESRPFTAKCFANRAAAFQALGQIPDAIADCNLAIALDRSYMKAISRRATLYEMIRDYEEAASDHRRLVALLTKQGEEKGNRPSQAELRQAYTRLAQVEEQATKEPPLDFYLILGVEPSATSADLKKAYRKAALRHHPDKATQFFTRGENTEDWREMCEEVRKEADRLFKMIGEAYSVLSDPTKRFRYEEEVRNALKKPGGAGTSRMRPDANAYGYQRSASASASGRTWREAWQFSENPPNRRTSRFQ